MRFALLSAPLMLGACTTQLVTQGVAPAQKAVVGIPYTLPALQYRATVTRTLSDCVVEAGEMKPTFDVKIEVTPAYVEGETFVADYRALSAPTKTSSIKIETYENHTIKTVNAEADDKSPEVVGGVVKAGFSVARLALGLPSVGDLGGGASQKCPAMLGAYQKIVDAIKGKTKALADLNEELEPYVVAGLLATLTDEDKEKIKILRGQIRDVSKALAELQKKGGEYETVLTFVETLDLDFSASQQDRVISFPSTDPAVAAAQRKWLGTLFGAEFDDVQWAATRAAMKPLVATLRPIAGPAAGSDTCKAAGLVQCLTTVPEWKKDDRGRLPRSFPGIAYRQPVKARLRICEGRNSGDCAGGAAKPLVENEAWAPQIGMLVILPFRNGFGANNQLQAQFRSDGSLDWASYSEKRAVAVAAVDMANGALDQALSLSDAIAAKKEAATTAAKADADAAAAAPLASLQNQLALAKAQRELLEVQSALDPANAEIARQQALLNARIAQLNAQVTIKELEAKLEP